MGEDGAEWDGRGKDRVGWDGIWQVRSEQEKMGKKIDGMRWDEWNWKGWKGEHRMGDEILYSHVFKRQKKKRLIIDTLLHLLHSH